MAKSDTERNAEWRRRLMLKSSIFDDLNAERAARIRQAFPGDGRPEVRAVVEFFANYPRCQAAPTSLELVEGCWRVDLSPLGNPFYEAAAVKVALSEITSIPLYSVAPAFWINNMALRTVRDEVAEMRALGLWGRS